MKLVELKNKRHLQVPKISPAMEGNFQLIPVKIVFDPSLEERLVFDMIKTAPQLRADEKPIDSPHHPEPTLKLHVTFKST